MCVCVVLQVMYNGEHVVGYSDGEETILGFGVTNHLSPAYVYHRSVGYVFLQENEDLVVSADTRALTSDDDQLEVFT